MQSHPDAHAQLQQLRAQIPLDEHETRLMNRVGPLVNILKDIGHGYLSIKVERGALVRLDVSLARGSEHP
jgi:hypothetical protein